MRRVEVLDVWRSLCIIGMIIYHTMYDLILFGRLDGAVMRTWPAQALHYFVVGGFILISGIAARFSRNGFRRALDVVALLRNLDQFIHGLRLLFTARIE